MVPLFPEDLQKQFHDCLKDQEGRSPSDWFRYEMFALVLIPRLGSSCLDSEAIVKLVKRLSQTAWEAISDRVKAYQTIYREHPV